MGARAEVISEEEFFKDEKRRKSPEVDFGAWWGLLNRNDEKWRVSWIEDTGELYAACRGTVIVLGVYKTREEVEERMRGWEEQRNQVLASFFNLDGWIIDKIRRVRA
jgi:hypothetical protein